MALRISTSAPAGAPSPRSCWHQVAGGGRPERRSTRTGFTSRIGTVQLPKIQRVNLIFFLTRWFEGYGLQQRCLLLLPRIEFIASFGALRRGGRKHGKVFGKALRQMATEVLIGVDSRGALSALWVATAPF
jgi:hypothetical protein